jgi:hypothetical protein
MAGRQGVGWRLVWGLALGAWTVALSSSPAAAQAARDVTARNAQNACDFPWTYSAGLARCVCVQEGYALRQGDCLPRAETVTAVLTPDTEASATPPATPVDKKTELTRRVQRCYAQLGYYKGPIDGKANDATWTAHWFFKNDHGLKSYGDFLADRVLEKIDELCKDEPEAEPQPVEAAISEPAEGTEEPAAAPAPSDEATIEPGADTNPETVSDAAQGEWKGDTVTAAIDPEPAETSVEDEPSRPPTKLALDCLPEDLIQVLRKAEGETVRVRACPRGCYPSPNGLSQPQLDDLQSRYGVVWCRSCVPIKGHLPLDDIKRIEEEGNLELCATPPRQLPRPGLGNGNVVESFSRIRELYRGLSTADEDPNAIAVIIGNAAYDNLPAVETAWNDAGAMYFFLTEHLGFRQDRIIDLRNARRADFERVFGPVPGSDGELKRLVEAQAGARVVVYYSGHGATNADHSETYLLPVEAEPYREARRGYPLSTLYDNLAALKAESVFVLLETTYGRDHGAYLLPPNLPETTRSALPEKPLKNLTVLLSADRGQRALIDTSYNIGLFTRYLVEGLAGSADLYPVGNEDGKVDSAELYAYAAAMTRLSARKTFGLLQQPAYSSGETTVLSDSGAVAAKPQ